MIAVDAMGGDFAPGVVIQGALSCAKKYKIPVCLFGPQEKLESLLYTKDSCWRDLDIKIVDACEEIAMGEPAVSAVKSKKKSSLVCAVKAVAEGSCKSVVSAGNSGAMMAASVFFIGKQADVDRPALIGCLPGKSGPFACLDLGANTDCKPENLVTFAPVY